MSLQLKKAELVGALADKSSQFTVFAPNNAAFTAAGVTSLDGLDKAALTPILQYHVLNSEVKSTALPATDGVSAVIGTLNGNFFLTNAGGGVFINGDIQVTAIDLDVDNGVVHVVNKMISPASGDIVQVASTNSDFDVLVAALTRTTTEGNTNLVSVLKGEGPFTVFAPTDAAFISFTAADDEAAAIAAVNGLPIETLVTVLQYHVVGAAVASGDVKAGEVTSVSTDEFMIAIDGSSIKIQDGSASTPDATISATNVLASNGLIHVIDQVISPN